MMGGQVEARKQLVSKGNEDRIVQSPLVADCENICLFKDQEQKNYWCFDFSTPNLKMGWEWKQTNNTEDDATPIKYFRQDIAGYAQLYFKVKSELKLDELYFNEFTLDIPSFKTYLYAGMIINQRFQYCPGVGYNIDNIDLELTMIQKMQNCWITLLKNFWSVDGVWTGKGAKIFDDCEWAQDSNDDPEVELDFTKWEFFDKITDQMLVGTSDPESAQYCVNLVPGGVTLATDAATASYLDATPRVRSSNSGFVQQFYQNLFDYAGTVLETKTVGSEKQILGEVEVEEALV